jgi:hypothetical protein
MKKVKIINPEGIVEKTEKSAGKKTVWVGEKLGVWNTIGEAMLFMKDNYALLLAISLASVAVQALLNLLPVKEIPVLGLVAFVGIFAGIFISLWANAAIVIAMGNLYYGKKVSFAESFNAAMPKIWAYVVNNILMFVLVAIGTVVFIIPGLYISVIYSFVAIAVLLEDDKKVSPFKISAALVKRYFWAVTVYSLAVGVTMAPLMAACVAGAFLLAGNIKVLTGNPILMTVFYLIQALFMPYMCAANFMLYVKLKEIKKDSPELTDPAKLEPKLNGCLVLAGLLFLIIFIVIFMAVAFKGPHK